MDEFIAYPSRSRMTLLAIGAATFVSMGLWMGGLFGTPLSSSRYPPDFVFIIGWLCVVFFGFCGAAAIKGLIDGREVLRIGPAGIRAATWSDQTIPWPEILDVTTWSHGNQKFVVLHLRDKSRFPGRGMAAMLRGLNRGLTGGDICISLTGTDRTVEDALSSTDRFRSQTA